MKTKLERLNPHEGESISKMTRDESIKDILESIPNRSCAFIRESDMKLIEYHFDLQADVDAVYFENGLYDLELFFEYGKTPSDKHFYFVIHRIDTVDAVEQLKFLGLVKDRYIKKFDDLLDDITIVFTVNSLETVKNIDHLLWNIGYNLLK